MILLEGKNLSKSFSDNKRKTIALSDFSFFLNEGEILGIVGESGCGKSTLLKVISGMLLPDEGKLFYRGEEYTGKKPRQTGKFLQFIFQNAKSSFDPRMTMEKALYESGGKRADKEKMGEVLERVGIDMELLKRKAGALSGGQCQRMSIARALYSGADILLCDEITSALDVSSQAQITGLLGRLRDKGDFSAIFVSHDIALVASLCDRLIVMKDGRCIEQGDTQEIIENPKQDYTKLLIESAKKHSI